MVEDRKIYVRRVSSNVCDLRKAARPFLAMKSTVEPGAGLFETFLVVGLYYDRQLLHHTPYIKSSYPNQVHKFRNLIPKFSSFFLALLCSYNND